MKQHIYSVLSSERRRLGLSQRELAMRAGLSREKISRLESKAEDISFDDLARLLDVIGLQLEVRPKIEQAAIAGSDLSRRLRPLVPQAFAEAAVFDGSKAKILSWGKLPK